VDPRNEVWIVRELNEVSGSHNAITPAKDVIEALYSCNIGLVMAANAEFFKRVLSQVKGFGLLLESDPKLPSVSTIITGSPLRSSWWSHPLSHTIFDVNGRLEDHPDVLVTKLVAGKVTFVHRELWPQILAIGTARERWQTETLSAPAQALLEMIGANGSLRTDELILPSSLQDAGKLKPARELERKLLVNSAQFHTERGAHAKLLESWEHWAERIGFVAPSLSVAEAKEKMETRLKKLNEQFGAKARLPWQA
jgi:hypothetical protein